MKKRIGILGGVFDPVHIGHLAVAGTVFGRFRLDTLYVIPSANPPHKTAPVLKAEERLLLTQTAFRDVPGVVVSDIELARGGVSYTFETLELIANQEGEKPFFFIGDDNIPEIKTWKHPERVLKAAYVVAVTRPGFDPVDAFPEYKGLITPMDMPPMPVSSTDIRYRLKQGLDVSDAVPADVLAIIRENRWYC